MFFFFLINSLKFIVLLNRPLLYSQSSSLSTVSAGGVVRAKALPNVSVVVRQSKTEVISRLYQTPRPCFRFSFSIGSRLYNVARNLINNSASLLSKLFLNFQTFFWPVSPSWSIHLPSFQDNLAFGAKNPPSLSHTHTHTHTPPSETGTGM